MTGIPHRVAGHHGGCRVGFAPGVDQYLYVTTGDNAIGTNPQDLDSRAGKVLRVDPVTGEGVPTNPFYEAGAPGSARSQIFTYGHRNPQGFAPRPGTNQIFTSEHGPDRDDEVNLLVAGGNMGWNPVPEEDHDEVNHDDVNPTHVDEEYNELVPMTDLDLFPDAVEAIWSSGWPTVALSGATFVSGAAWGDWDGALVIANLKASRLMVLTLDAEGDVVSTSLTLTTFGRLRSVRQGPDGALYVATSNSDRGNPGGRDRILRVAPGPPKPTNGDFDGDASTDPAVWRPTDGVWYVEGGEATQWGAAGVDVPVPADYNGDTIADIAVWRKTNGVWYQHGGSNTQWGTWGDVPVPANYDGDADDDLAVWRPWTGFWHVFGGSNTQWGTSGDIPVPANYDGDADDDLAVWRPWTGFWHLYGGPNVQWGAPGDVPVPADYDGDGTDEIVVWRPQTGTWYFHDGRPPILWGIPGDVPMRGDFNGDGLDDIAVWRPSTGVWHVRDVVDSQWGVYFDTPVADTQNPAVRALS